MTKLYTITILFFLFFSKIILAVSWSDFTYPACSFFKENTMMCVTAGTSAVAAFTSYRWFANNRYAAVLTREIEIKNKAIKEKNKEIEK